MIRTVVVAALATVLIGQRAAAAQELTLTLDDALARAREHAPAVLVARTRIDEARGAQVDAAAPAPDNPKLGGSVGPRWSPGGQSADWQVEVSQALRPPGERTALLAAATAGVEQAAALAEDAARQALGDVARAFLTTLAAQERVRVTAEDEEAAFAVRGAVEQRAVAGDATALDVHLARVEAVRTRAGRGAAEAALATGLASLRAQLALDPGAPLHLDGALAVAGGFDLPTLLAHVADRPDVRAFEAERRTAEAEVRVGRSMALPAVDLRAGYAREGGDQLVTGGISLTLPAFQRGQGTRRSARARAERARIEADAARRTAEAEVRGAHEAWRQLSDAARDVEAEGLPALAGAETLALRSYQAGEIGLEALVLTRRQAQDTRLALLDRLLDAALAAVDLQVRAGVLP